MGVMIIQVVDEMGYVVEREEINAPAAWIRRWIALAREAFGPFAVISYKRS